MQVSSRINAMQEEASSDETSAITLDLGSSAAALCRELNGNVFVAISEILMKWHIFSVLHHNI